MIWWMDVIYRWVSVPVRFHATLPNAQLTTTIRVIRPHTVLSSSVSHIPQFMIMGQAAGTVAALVAASGAAVQDVDVDTLHAALVNDGQLTCINC